MLGLLRRPAVTAMSQIPAQPHHVTIIGGGPAGLMAAEVLSQAGVRVDLYDGMPSVGRKFLLAGVGGMNITHSEAYPAFLSRYAEPRRTWRRCCAALVPRRCANGSMAWVSRPSSAPLAAYFLPI